MPSLKEKIELIDDLEFPELLISDRPGELEDAGKGNDQPTENPEVEKPKPIEFDFPELMEDGLGGEEEKQGAQALDIDFPELMGDDLPP